MEQLYPINVGQQANDGTGDPLRNGMQMVNANFTKVQAGVDAVESMAANAEATAVAAKAKADGDIPATEKGMAGGVAPLDASGKVPAAHLPELADSIPVEEKGAAGGVAPLDAGAKVPVANLPAGTAGGVAPLGADGKVPAINLPAAEDSIPLSQKGQPGGVATLDTGGKVPASQLPPIPTGPPAGSVAWWSLRTSIPAGQIPADGQTVSRATFPDLAAMVTGGKVPVVTEADWLADPLKRGSYTLGDGSTTIRLPDLNGQSSGSLGAVFQRGDGFRSGSNGRLQADQLGPMQYSVAANFSSATNLLVNGSLSPVLTSGNSANLGLISGVAQAGDGNKWIRNTGDETRPLNVSGVWTIHAFGVVTNPGSADAAQLASDYAALNSAFQTLSGQLAFTILYPNGGTAANPASVAANSTYVLTPPAPFLGFSLICRAEMLYTDGWAETGWYTDSSGGNRAFGTRAGQLSNGAILVRTGASGVDPLPNLGGTPTQGSLVSPNKCRVLVWRVKG
ncbi:phage tail protein [Achromobacter xylosoxidans]|uniref:phage tail protein n=1 Tax=Alcaligenes xylosoxydans xylosoxydans TaxID=85698 RepID=UPI001788ABAA|nr:phage tail protein [Achromobacter xylosoxidans]